MNRLFKWATILVVFYLAVPVALALYREGLIIVRGNALLSALTVAVPAILAAWGAYRWLYRQPTPSRGPRTPKRKQGKAMPPTVQLGEGQRQSIESALPEELVEFLEEEREFKK